MKKLFALLTLFSFLMLGTVSTVNAQDEPEEPTTEQTEMTSDSTDMPSDSTSMENDSAAAEVEPVDAPAEMAPEEEEAPELINWGVEEI